MSQVADMVAHVYVMPLGVTNLKAKRYSMLFFYILLGLHLEKVR